ncbi:hypothetical protein [Rhizobium bangladeshense]|uniref:hypothetical protein n=1 Tax=Rhizobium bangladeshense TaxID=1138189 RepID=UPI001A98E497|nr:hypothetical protein [Rhizobium bangladeshense]MBX4920304.1 hypothetical protein [Rhizobium bangladeshense]MBX4935197.1 hypothetical protein [Rhizobium bangladeshense]QSY91700.1 hypothetical protein J2J98_24685 [Rhizobium bangladeshense]
MRWLEHDVFRKLLKLFGIMLWDIRLGCEEAGGLEKWFAEDLEVPRLLRTGNRDMPLRAFAAAA